MVLHKVSEEIRKQNIKTVINPYPVEPVLKVLSVREDGNDVIVAEHDRSIGEV